MARIPGGKSASTRAKQNRKPKADSRKLNPSIPQTSKPASLEIHGSSGLDVEAVGEVVEDLRGIAHVLGTASPLVEHARLVARTMLCDQPERRDALARLGQRLTGRDIDRFGPHNLRLIDDALLDDMIQAADAVIDAALWRLDRLRCVLVRATQRPKAETPTADSRIGKRSDTVTR